MLYREEIPCFGPGGLPRMIVNLVAVAANDLTYERELGRCDAAIELEAMAAVAEVAPGATSAEVRRIIRNARCKFEDPHESA